MCFNSTCDHNAFSCLSHYKKLTNPTVMDKQTQISQRDVRVSAEVQLPTGHRNSAYHFQPFMTKQIRRMTTSQPLLPLLQDPENYHNHSLGKGEQQGAARGLNDSNKLSTPERDAQFKDLMQIKRINKPSKGGVANQVASVPKRSNQEIESANQDRMKDYMQKFEQNHSQLQLTGSSTIFKRQSVHSAMSQLGLLEKSSSQPILTAQYLHKTVSPSKEKKIAAKQAIKMIRNSLEVSGTKKPIDQKFNSSSFRESYTRNKDMSMTTSSNMYSQLKPLGTGLVRSQIDSPEKSTPAFLCKSFNTT